MFTASPCVVYETLAGRPPFQREDDVALLWAHQYDEPPPPSGARPDLPAAVDAVFARALAKSPDSRFDTCLGFVAALRSRPADDPGDSHLAHEPDTAATSGPPPHPPRWAGPVFR